MNRIQHEKTYKLYTPGPGNVPARIEAASSYINYHHRTKEFGAMLCDGLDKLKPVFGTEEQIITVHTTGRGAIEGAFNNCLSRENDKVLCVCNGRFGEMGKEIVQAIGIGCIPCYENWTDIVDPEKIRELAIENKVTAVFMVHSDTSTGVINPVAEVGKVCRELNLLFFVDVISSFACMPFKFDEWGVDIAVAGIQKGLMCPAGMSVMAVSKRAMAAHEKIPQRDYYINIGVIRNFLITKREAPLTAPVSLGLAMNEAANMITEEGVENVFRRHKMLSLATKSAVEAMGFELFPKGDGYVRTDSLTVCTLPDEIDRTKLINHIKEKYGLLLSSGIGSVYTHTIRIAHMGYCYVEDMLECISALECSLYELGYCDSIGAGLKAFMDTYNQMEKKL